MPSTSHGSEIATVHPQPAQEGGRVLDRRFAMSAYRTGSANDARRCARVERPVLTDSRPGRSRRTTSASSVRLVRDSGRPMTFIAETRRAEFGDFPTNAHRMRSHARRLNPSRARALYGRKRRISSDSAARERAAQIPNPLPRCLRPPSFTNRSTESPNRRQSRNCPASIGLTIVNCHIPFPFSQFGGVER